MKELKPFYLDLTADETNELRWNLVRILNSGQLILENIRRRSSERSRLILDATMQYLLTVAHPLEVLCMMKGAWSQVADIDTILLL